MLFKNITATSKQALIPAISLCLSACGGTISHYENQAQVPTNYRDVESRSKVTGIGIESSDIAGIVDDMYRDLIVSGILSNRNVPPRVVIDSQYIVNESSARLNKNIITDWLRTELIRASLGKIVFINRENIALVEKERELKRQGRVDVGTVRLTKASAGVDFRLVGRIASMDAVSSTQGMHDKTYLFTFELLDMELGNAIYALGPYTVSKYGQDDAIYR